MGHLHNDYGAHKTQVITHKIFVPELEHQLRAQYNRRASYHTSVFVEEGKRVPFARKSWVLPPLEGLVVFESFFATFMADSGASPGGPTRNVCFEETLRAISWIGFLEAILGRE
jgi:hypothetical protein